MDYASYVKNAVRPTDRLRSIFFRDSARRACNLSIIITISLYYYYFNMKFLAGTHTARWLKSTWIPYYCYLYTVWWWAISWILGNPRGIIQQAKPLAWQRETNYYNIIIIIIAVSIGAISTVMFSSKFDSSGIACKYVRDRLAAKADWNILFYHRSRARFHIILYDKHCIINRRKSCEKSLAHRCLRFVIKCCGTSVI